MSVHKPKSFHESRNERLLFQSIAGLAATIAAATHQREIEFAWVQQRCCKQDESGAGEQITRHDFEKLKRDILKAIGTRVNPREVRELTEDLQDSSGPLAAAVEDNQPAQ